MRDDRHGGGGSGSGNVVGSWTMSRVGGCGVVGGKGLLLGDGVGEWVSLLSASNVRAFVLASNVGAFVLALV